MENFFYEDEFCPDLERLMDVLNLDDEASIYALPDDWSVTGVETSLEPVFELTEDWIMDRIDEERWDEEGELKERVGKLLRTIDFKAINDKMPKLHYMGKKDFTITKDDLIEYIK